MQIPSIINDLVNRLIVKATDAEYEVVLAKLNALKPVIWFNLLPQLSKVEVVIKEYQDTLVDDDVADSFISLPKILWFDIFNRVNELIKAVELIESL